MLAEGKRLDVPEAEVRGWYNRAAHPDNRFGLHRVMDWRFDLAEFWRKCGRGRRSGPEAVAESSAPRPPARELSPGMKRMSVEGALKRLAEQIANHPGTFAIASEADKGRVRDLHRLRKKLQAELTELDAELVSAS